LREASLRYVIVTDISRDGMLAGPNILLLKQAVSEGFRVIASGGVSSLADLELLAEKLPKLEGVIVGKAIYEKIFTVQEALERLKASEQ
jgi:phosphoribosylformimino-5-aminoimidazole carboxamide ribonucleotide (ProFAR) isomerase